MKNSITNSFWFFLCFALILGVAPAGSWAASYYVATNGNDSNIGTIDLPWKTLNKARSVGPGSTVYFRGGTYYGTLSPNNSGTSSAWITFTAYPGEQAYIVNTNGDAVTIKTINGGNYSYAQQRSYIEISNLDIQGSLKGVRIDQAHHIRIIDNVIHDSKIGGISVPNGTDHLLIQGNTIYGNCTGGPPCSSGISIWNSGCFFGTSSTCSVLNDGAEGYHIIIRNNIIYGNTNDGGVCNSPVTDGNGVILDNNGDDNPLTLVANNLIYHNGGRCVQSLNSPNVHIINNTCWENLQTDRMQNNGTSEINLQYNSQIGTVNWDNHPVVIKNNLVYGRGDGCLYGNFSVPNDGYESDYNLWYQDDADGSYDTDYSNVTGGNRPCNWNLGSNEIRYSDPSFTATPTCTGSDPYYSCDWENEDFRLQSGSPAINSGTNEFASVVSTDYDGNPRSQGGGYDIGAYEFMSGPSLAPPSGLQIVK